MDPVIDSRDLGAIVVGALTFHTTSLLWGIFFPTLPHVLVLVAMAALAVFLVLTPVLPVDWDRHGRPIAAVVVLVFVLAIVTLYVSRTQEFDTDIQLLAVESAKLFVAGENPYTASFADAMREAGVPPTPRVDGSGVVSTFSYPGGNVLTFVPQYLLGVEDAGVSTVSAFAVGVCLLVVHEAPDDLTPITLTVLFGFTNVLFLGFRGGIGPVWMFPLMVGMYWWGRRPRASAAALGWAAGVKQLVWPPLAFVALWVWLDSADAREFGRDAARYAAWGGGAFLLLNLPFLLLSPEVWLASVFDPVFSSKAPLVAVGWGLAAFTTHGVYPMSTTAHLGFVALTTVGAAWLYVRWWPRSRWAAFAVTPLVLLGHYRYLPNYVVYFVPVAYYAWIRHNQQEGGFDGSPE